MPSGAMCFSALLCMKCSKVLSSLTTLAIDLWGYWLEMSGVHAPSHATKMVDLQAFRDWANQQLIS